MTISSWVREMLTIARDENATDGSLTAGSVPVLHLARSKPLEVNDRYGLSVSLIAVNQTVLTCRKHVVLTSMQRRTSSFITVTLTNAYTLSQKTSSTFSTVT